MDLEVRKILEVKEMEINNIEKLKKEIGSKNVDKLVTEYFLELVYKANKYDELVKAINKKDATIDNVKEIINND